METQPVYVGIDVGKSQLDVARAGAEEVWTLDNDEAGIRELVGRLRVIAPELVVMEATGGFEMPAAAAIAAASIAVVIANPRHSRSFAKSTGQLAKTDTIDARGLALFAERVKPQVRELPTEEARALEALISRRRQIIEMITAERNRPARPRIHAPAPGRPGLRRPHLDRSSVASGWRREPECRRYYAEERRIA